MISLFLRGGAFMLQHYSLTGRNGLYSWMNYTSDQDMNTLLNDTEALLQYCEGSQKLMVRKASFS